MNDDDKIIQMYINESKISEAVKQIKILQIRSEEQSEKVTNYKRQMQFNILTDILLKYTPIFIKENPNKILPILQKWVDSD